MRIYCVKPEINSYEVPDLDLMQVAKLISDTDLKLVRRFVRLHESIKDRWVQPECPLSEPFQMEHRYLTYRFGVASYC